MPEEKKTVHNFEFVGCLINILKILQEEADECTTISQPEILKLLEEKDCPCSARTLTDYLKTIMKEVNPEDVDGYVYENATIDDYLIIPRGLEEKLHARDLGLSKAGAKKLQLRSLRYNQMLTFEELNQVIEAVLFLKNLDEQAKEKLIKKILRTSSKNFPRKSPYISANTGAIYTKIKGVYENSRIDENAVRENIKVIRNGIEADREVGRKIVFHFNGYNESKELIPRSRKDGSLVEYIANPYYIIFYNAKPYLVCALEPHQNVSIYRIDLMSDIKILEKPTERSSGTTRRRAKSEIEGLPKGWTSKEVGKFQAEYLYMHYGKPKRIILKMHRERYTLLHDYFGEHYEFIRHIDEDWDEVEVSCVPDAMISLALQCSDYIEILKPIEVRTMIREKCEKLLKKYS